MPSTENILQRLLALLSSSYEFKTVSRRLAHPSQVTLFPALFAISPGENYPPREIRGLPPKVTIDVQVWIYTSDGKNPDAVPEASLNDAKDAVVQMLSPRVMQGPVQTLNIPGVQHCWVEGHVEKFPGVLDGIAKAIIPVKILLA